MSDGIPDSFYNQDVDVSVGEETSDTASGTPDSGFDRGQLRDSRSEPEPAPEPDPEPSGTPDDGFDRGQLRDDRSEPDPAPSGGGGSGTTGGGSNGGDSGGGPLDNLVEETLNPAAETFDEQIAETAGEVVRRSSPATVVDSQIPGGSPVGRTIENSVRGAANILNAPGIAAGAIRAGQRAADDTARVDEQGAAGRQANRRELASDVVEGATTTGTAIQNDPVGTLSRIGGGIVGGAALGGAASRAARAARGSPDAPDTPDGTVPSGRSDAGTDGVDSLLADVDVDARRGTSGPSTRSRIEGEVSRAVDDVTERVDDSPLGDFLDDERAQLQQQRPSGRDTGSAPDRTRPADAGGSFEDIRQDSLTQTQDQLRSDATRPDPGTFEGAPSPFRSGGGDTIDPDGGVSLERGSGVVDDAAGSSSGGGSGGGFGAGLGSLSGADPTGIADTDSPAGGTALDPAQILGAGTGSTGTEAVSERNDPSGIAPGSLGELGDGRLGGGTLPGDATGGGVDTGTNDATNDPTNVAPPGSRTDTGTETDTFSPTDTGSDTGSEPGTDTPTDTATTTADVLATTTLTGTRSGTDAAGTGTSLPGSPTLGEPVTSTDAGLRLAPRDGDAGGRPVRPRGEEEADQDDDAAPLLGFATDSREFGSGIASASDFLDGDGARDPFSL